MRVPFDEVKLKNLLEAAEIDLLLANTRHNVRYLTGGYHYYFHAAFQRMGRSQYIPFVGLVRSDVRNSFYICRENEFTEMTEAFPWITNRVEAVRGTLTTAATLVETIRSAGLTEGRIAVEMAFLPADIYVYLREHLPAVKIADATPIIEELRTIKSDAEIAHMHTVYDRVAESIQEGFSQSGEGDATAEIESRVRLAMASRGVNFLFALISTGPNLSRTPSADIVWKRGAPLHIDAGGEVNDYIADICRMGCVGEPSPLAAQMHHACLKVQDTARGAIAAGVPVKDVLRVGMEAVASYPFSEFARFVVHSIGVVPYEQPNVTTDRERPLEPGMVLSIETDFIHPVEGHIKIEDSVVVTETGCDGLGDLGRDWNIR
jgi:Xaa-Pro aminopeptidase